jgi:hypothetical protein
MAMAFKDPLDEEADEAGKRSVEKHAGRMAERVATAREEDPETFDVEPPEPPELDDDDEGEVTVTERQRKRSARKSYRERAAAAEAASAAYKEALALSGGRPAPTGPAAPQSNPYLQIDAEIRKTFQEEKALNERWIATSAKASPAEIQRMEDEAAELVVRRTGLVADRKEIERAPRRAEEAKIHDQRSRFPDVFGDSRAFQYAQGSYNQALARGVAPSRELEDASFQEAREVILGRRPPPDAAQRQRASGMGSSTRQVSGGAAKTTIDMPRGGALYRMAIATYPDLEPAQACQKWAQTKGKRYQEALSARGR